MSRPKCYGCGDKPARRLNLPGSYGSVAYFCSLRCAAREVIAGLLSRCMEWCPKHGVWHDDGCYDCDKEAHYSNLD